MTNGVKKSHRERVRMQSQLPAAEYIAQRLEESGMSNIEFSERLGYPRPNVIAMIKNGDMRLPHSKVLPAAKALGIDPAFLMRKVMQESDAELWGSIEAIFGQNLMSEDELEVLTFIRQRLDGFDARLAKNEVFMDELGALIDAAREREAALVQATRDRIERERKARQAARS